jgi:nickel-dependent lactate racemase
LEGNPAHEDLLEACQLLNPAFLLNVVLTPRGEVARAVAGHYDLAHREGCKFVDQMYRMPIPAPYDVVIASAGGYPLDIDLRQAHKGLENAARALRPGGALLYFADCPEGAGRETIERWVRRYASSAEMAEALRRKFVFGGHKAYWLARLAERARIFLVSSLPDSLVRACRFVPVSDPEATLAAILAESSQAPRVALIPYASYTLPTLQGEELLSPARSRAEVDIRT